MTYNEPSEFKDYSNFLRFFSSRMVQAVVQARMGKMLSHPCTPNPEQTDYFNVVIDEIGEISAYLKSTIGKNYPPHSKVMALEFILYTDDGDTLPLETWVIRLDSDCQDCSAHHGLWTSSARTSFYHQLSTLLRSLIVASRFTPTYRHYVRQEQTLHGTETFVITYRVFEGEPDISQLGDEYKCRKLGQLPTPFGVLFVELNYRTKMEIQPQPFVDETAKVQNVVDIVGNNPMAVAVPQEGSETVPISSSFSDNINLFSASPISQDLPFTSPSNELRSSVPFPRHRSSSDIDGQNQTESPRASNSFPQQLAAHKNRMRNNSFPFASLFLESQTSASQMLPRVPENVERVHFACGENEDNTRSEVEEAEKGQKSEWGDRSREEDEEEGEQSSDSSYVKVIAFADGVSSDELGTDLSEFVKEVKLAPDDLRSFSSEPVGDLSRQLDDFRAKKSTFNKFVADVIEMENDRPKEAEE